MGRTRANRISASIKDRYAQTNQGKQIMSVAEYIERRDFRNNRTWTLSQGQWFVDVNGMLLMGHDFDILYPAKLVEDFKTDMTNVGKNRI